jgi:phosphoglycolate phosphatase-like HAD superfamily hydrolase
MTKAGQWAVLLDLDQTLVLTQAVEPLRKRRLWSSVYKSLNATFLPPGTMDFLNKIQKIVKLGVVTTSPRPYALRVLAHHRIDIPVLVAYHDVSKLKPHPEPILKAAEKLNILPSLCIHVGDQEGDIVAAHRAGAVAIGISWDGSLRPFPTSKRSMGPFDNWSGVFDAVENLLNGRSESSHGS